MAGYGSFTRTDINTIHSHIFTAVQKLASVNTHMVLYSDHLKLESYSGLVSISVNELLLL